jgi:hypothetical protein
MFFIFAFEVSFFYFHYENKKNKLEKFKNNNIIELFYHQTCGLLKALFLAYHYRYRHDCYLSCFRVNDFDKHKNPLKNTTILFFIYF